MIKFIKNMPYHFKSAWKSLTRNIAITVSSATAVTVTLILVSMFLMIAGNLNEMSQKIESSVQIYVQIDPIVEEDGFVLLQEEIEALPHVKKVKFSSAEEQFDIFLESDDGGSEYEIFREDNPLPAAFYVDATDGKYVKQISDKIANMEGIMSSNFGGDNATKMIEAFDSIRIGGGILVASLCFLAIFLISNTIKITIHGRSDEIAIMRFVGADNLFIKTPFMLEGMLIGFMGAIIPVILTLVGYFYLYDLLGGQLFSSMFVLQAPVPFALYISLTLLVIAMGVGIIGSFFSVNKYLKWKR